MKIFFIFDGIISNDEHGYKAYEYKVVNL